VSSSSDEILAQRRVRSSELALEAARRRLDEAYAEVAELRARVAQLDAALADSEARTGVEPARLRAELAIQGRARRRAEQEAQAERARADELEQTLLAQTPPGEAQGLERELGVAQRRIRGLEADLEIVRRQTSDFEQVIRLAVDEAWGWLGEVSQRAAAALGAVETLRHRSAPSPRFGPSPGPVAPERLDEALTRLRAAPPDDEPASTG
jgi:chromosome segregation ATPase